MIMKAICKLSVKTFDEVHFEPSSNQFQQRKPPRVRSVSCEIMIMHPPGLQACLCNILIQSKTAPSFNYTVKYSKTM